MDSGSENDWNSRSEPDDPGQRVGPLAVLPDMLREFRVDPEAVLRDRGLPPDALASPERRIPYFQLGRLFKSAAESTGCEHFGLLFGQRLGLRHVGIPGEMARNAATVGEAIRTMAVHQRLFSRGAMAFVLTEGRRATLGYSTFHASTVGADHVHDGMAAWMLNIVRELTGPGWTPDVILLARSRPRSTVPYRRALPARIEFNAEFTGMRFGAGLLDRKIPGADPHRFRVFEGQIAAIGHNSFLNDVRRALRVQMLHGDAANDHVAQTLEMHRRTLHRRLRESGTAFREILDEVRYDTARHMLHTTEMPLMEIAVSLGYSDVTAFTRAFRRWSGTTPSGFRDGRPSGDDGPRTPAAPASGQDEPSRPVRIQGVSVPARSGKPPAPATGARSPAPGSDTAQAPHGWPPLPQ
jgi:AraC-like DNA-binding protein